MTSVEIVDVALTESDAEQLRGRNIEVPKTGSRIDNDTIPIIGWVLGRSSPLVTVEVVHDGRVLQSASIDVRRPDVAAAFTDASEAEQSGFRTTVAVPNTEESELFVQAVFRDESRVPLGIIRARQSGSGKERYSESTVHGQSGALRRFLRRGLGRGGG